jgi:tetratricopeptide (TPR) repeat protein
MPPKSPLVFAFRTCAARIVLLLLALTLWLHLQPLLRAQTAESATDPRVAKLYSEAKAAQALDDDATAIAKYESILQIAPSLGAAYNNLGALYLRQGEYGKAADILRKGLKVNPGMPSASALLGVALYQMGEYVQARPALEAALHANPKDDNAELMLAKDLVKLDDSERAASHLQQLALRQPKNQEVFYLLGQVYMQLSEKALTRLNAIDPGSVFAHEISGDVMASMKNYEGALVEYKKAVEMAPQQAGTHYKLGDAYWNLTEWDAAAQQFQAELAIDAHNCVARWKLGNALLAQHLRPEEALADVDQALAVCPKLTQARVDRARALMLLGRNEEALADLTQAEQASPDEPSIHFLMSQAYRALGRPQDARTEMAVFSKLEEAARAAVAKRANEVLGMQPNPH